MALASSYHTKTIYFIYVLNVYGWLTTKMVNNASLKFQAYSNKINPIFWFFQTVVNIVITKYKSLVTNLYVWIFFWPIFFIKLHIFDLFSFYSFMLPLSFVEMKYHTHQINCIFDAPVEIVINPFCVFYCLQHPSILMYLRNTISKYIFVIAMPIFRLNELIKIRNTFWYFCHTDMCA